MKNILLLCVLALASCKASVSGDDVFKGVGGNAPVDQMEIPNLPLGGTVQSKFTTFRQGYVTPASNGEYRVTLVSNYSDLDCDKYYPEYAYFSALIPKGAGTYYSGVNLTELQRPLTYIYTDRTSGVTQNILSDKSKIVITDFNDVEVKGGAYATSASSTASFDVSGNFTLMNCESAQNKKLKVLKQGSESFKIVYSEIVPVQISGQWQYVFRAMDKIPAKKCNTWDAWMMTETPIKYIQTTIPQKEGEFKIAPGQLEVGFQGTAGGTSYSGFDGAGRVVTMDQFTTVLTLQTKEITGSNLETIGRITTSICDK